MSWFSQLFHPGGGYDQAGKTMNDYYNQAQGMRQPYMQQGQDAYKNLQEAMEKLKNPGALQDEWSKGYTESQYAKNLEGGAKERGLEDASSMGLMGSSAALSNIQNSSSNIMEKDRQQYMNDMMQKYMTGLGIGQNVYGTGANMASQGAQAAQQQGENNAGLQFGKYNAGPNMLGNMGGKMMDMIMQYMTGGFGGGK